MWPLWLRVRVLWGNRGSGIRTGCRKSSTTREWLMLARSRRAKQLRPLPSARRLEAQGGWWCGPNPRARDPVGLWYRPWSGGPRARYSDVQGNVAAEAESRFALLPRPARCPPPPGRAACFTHVTSPQWTSSPTPSQRPPRKKCLTSSLGTGWPRRVGHAKLTPAGSAQEGWQPQF